MLATQRYDKKMKITVLRNYPFKKNAVKLAHSGVSIKLSVDTRQMYKFFVIFP